MSYIKDELFGKGMSSKISSYLKEEGFQEDSGHQGTKEMTYFAQGRFTVRFTITNNYINLSVEYNCGGQFEEMEYHFDEHDFDDFIYEYKKAIDWSKDFI